MCPFHNQLRHLPEPPKDGPTRYVSRLRHKLRRPVRAVLNATATQGSAPPVIGTLPLLSAFDSQRRRELISAMADRYTVSYLPSHTRVSK
jgi:hypothetical protein